MLGAVVAAGGRLRGVDGGRRLAVLRVVLAVALFAQDGLGRAAARGHGTL